MLDSLRNAAKSWVAKALIFLLAASFGVWGIADVFTGYRADALATVGDQEISLNEFDTAFNRAVRQLGQQSGQNFTVEEARKLGIDRSILNNLIQSAAIDDLGQRMKLHVGDALIVQETEANPAFHDSAGKFNPNEFKRLLEANGLTEAGYLAGERLDKLRAAVTDSVDGEIAPSPTLAEAFYRHRNEQRDARFFVIKVAESEVAAPTDDEIKKHYDDRPAAYTAPEYRSVGYLSVDPAVAAAKVTLNDADVAAGYDKYKGDYFLPERRTVLQMSFPTVEEAQKAKDRLAAGEDFLAIAKERGIGEADATFADKTRADFLDPAVADAAFALAEGAVSEPVKGSLSTALVKVTKITPEHQKTLDEVKAELTERLRLERGREEINTVHDAVEDALGGGAKLEEIAAQVGIPFKLTAAVDAGGRDRAGADVDLPLKGELLKAVFESDVGVENSALSVDDTYVWYEVREVVPSAVKPLDQVKDQAKADVYAERLRKLAQEKAEALVARAGNGASLDSLAQEAGAAVQQAQGLKRNETSADFDSAAVAALFDVPENGFAYALEADGKGARVMQSQAVLLPPFDAASEESKSISANLKDAMANDTLAAYLAALQTEAGVSINEALWRQYSGTQTQ